jgi:RimJ/RimL family protein N-acetyltransferase
MPQRTNSFGQPIGEPVPSWTARPAPQREPLDGRLCRLEPLTAKRHAVALHSAYAADSGGANWTYLPYGPFSSQEDYTGFARWCEASDDTLFFAIVDRARAQPTGVASYLRIDPLMGCIEIGHISYSPALQQAAAATEAMYLMMRRVFDELGYRRYEWKCDSLNAPSRAAAERLGFGYEGTFRNAVVAKGRNRDTAWYSITDAEWPAIRDALEHWLEPANFDGNGRQIRRLRDSMPKGDSRVDPLAAVR